VATLIAVYGLFMPPIGWKWALLVWGYSLPFFLLNDRVKLFAYRIIDPIKTALQPQTKPEQNPMTNTKAKPEAKTDPKANVKTVPLSKTAANDALKPDAKAKSLPEADTTVPHTETKADPEARAKTSANLTPQLVKRVHEFYEELGREEVQAVNDMEKSERKTPKDKAHA
jgi:H+-transporting ATPase